jgi:two-component system nitrogen regulation response regulator GlnG
VVSLPELLSEFELAALPAPAGEAVAGSASAGIAREIESRPAFNLAATLAGIELQYIDAAIELAKGNMSQAARSLGISRSTLYSRLDALRPGTQKDRDPDT